MSVNRLDGVTDGLSEMANHRNRVASLYAGLALICTMAFSVSQVMTIGGRQNRRTMMNCLMARSLLVRLPESWMSTQSRSHRSGMVQESEVASVRETIAGMAAHRRS